MIQTSHIDPILGHYLMLRLIQPEDAGYVFGLRTDPTYNTHLSEVQGTAEDQRRWIASYKTREAAGQEFYHIIARKDGQPCGTVRLYDIGSDQFTWGSWILDASKPPKAALESAVLSFGFGFETLGRTEALIDVRHDNHRAAAFYRRFGMTETGQDDVNLYFTYTRSRFAIDRPMLWALLTEETPK
ncbi:MAG: GNAT family N-acetyltransferase [Rhodobacterales bacterium]